jgi:hypothetical protein
MFVPCIARLLVVYAHQMFFFIIIYRSKYLSEARNFLWFGAKWTRPNASPCTSFWQTPISSSRSLNTTVPRLSRFCHRGKLELLCQAHTVTRLKMNIICYHWLSWSALFNIFPVVPQKALNILIATLEGDNGVIGDDKGGTVTLDVTNLNPSSFFVLPPLKFSVLVCSVWGYILFRFTKFFGSDPLRIEVCDI